jgi:hypothetical protein
MVPSRAATVGVIARYTSGVIARLDRAIQSLRDKAGCPAGVYPRLDRGRGMTPERAGDLIFKSASYFGFRCFGLKCFFRPFQQSM